jgi:hypothetical protein
MPRSEPGLLVMCFNIVAGYVSSGLVQDPATCLNLASRGTMQGSTGGSLHRGMGYMNSHRNYDSQCVGKPRGTGQLIKHTPYLAFSVQGLQEPPYILSRLHRFHDGSMFRMLGGD